MKKEIAIMRTCVVALGILGISGACSPESSREKEVPAFSVQEDAVLLTPEKTAPVQFSVAPVEKKARLVGPPVTARVATVDALTAPSFAPLDGYVSEIAVKLGDRVQAGDRLVQVRTTQLAGLQHELRAAKLAAQTKGSIVERMKQMVEARAASQQDLIVAESEWAEAKFAVQAAAAKLQSLSVRLEGDTSYWVQASRSGVVVALDVSPGKQVSPLDERPLAIIADLEEVWVLGDVPQREVSAWRVGLQVGILVPGRSEALGEGEVEVTLDVVDPLRQTVPVRVRAKNPDRQLRPNSYVNLVPRLSAEETVLQVPSEAIVSDGADAVVFVQTEPGRFERRVVQVGLQAKQSTEIVSGLQEGEQVIVRGALLLLNALQMEE